MRKLAFLFVFAAMLFPNQRTPAQSQSTQATAPAAAPTQAPPPPQYTMAAPVEQPAARKITAYTLPPESYKKSQDLARIYLRFRLISFAFSVLVLWYILRSKWAVKYRELAERAFQNRFLQAVIFAPLFFITLDVLEMPFGIYSNWILRKYGISVQGWRSWFWDWTKGEIISAILSIVLLYLLFLVIRKSPQRWWFYFWLVTLPIGLILFFLQPLIIDPMFHKFEPLQTKDPALTASLETLVKRSGESIPRERMFWMGASEKSTDLNAYVTGFGASKRIVIWDTTIAKMNTPQITFVVGHEMGHYVLNHIPKLLGGFAAILFVAFYVGFRTIQWALAKWGAAWGVRGVEDYAATPCLLLILTLFFFAEGPLAATFSRHFEHQSDQYGLELTHGLTPDSGQVAAQAFQILGEVSYDDPNPSALRVFLFYDHPAIPDRVQFSLHYDPWGEGKQPEFVK
jgi:Zn-dependent protease with chaperone function